MGMIRLANPINNIVFLTLLNWCKMYLILMGSLEYFGLKVLILGKKKINYGFRLDTIEIIYQCFA
jgi:hypothetical protein